MSEDSINDAVRQLKAKMATARKLKDGWRVWLEFELAFVLNHVFGQRFLSEESIYEKRGRIDLWGKAEEKDSPEAPHALGIELKCEYESHSPCAGFLEDVAKV